MAENGETKAPKPIHVWFGNQPTGEEYATREEAEAALKSRGLNEANGYRVVDENDRTAHEAHAREVAAAASSSSGSSTRKRSRDE